MNMTKLHQRLALAIFVVVVLLLSVLYLVRAIETVASEFLSYEDAQKANAVGESKWLPDWLPNAATNIREVHNIDTNQVWLEFHIESGSALQTQGCELVDRSKIKETLPDVTASLAKHVGRDVAALTAGRDIQIYLCKGRDALAWGVIFQPSNRSVWSWNSVPK